MTRVSPLRKLHQQAEAALTVYPPGPPAFRAVPGSPAPPGPEGPPGAAPEAVIEMVETFGDREGEFAALCEGCILIDQPWRATIHVGGADRIEFLNRMLTQELKGLAPWRVRRAFWLNRKGRIDADLRVIALEDHFLFDLDAASAPSALRTLEAFVITEDVQLAERTEHRHRLALHGPTSLALLQAVGTHLSGAPLSDLNTGAACMVRIAGREILVDRQDSTGRIGLELLMDTSDVGAVYEQLIEAGAEHDGMNGSNGGATAARFRLRPAGWRAYNAARIEAGWPIFRIDFGPDSLPHESGALEDRVSFTKGCYLGQEIVARMQSLGHPKQKLVGLVFEPNERKTSSKGPPPPSGARLFPADTPDADAVGLVTSAAYGPAVGGLIGFGQVKYALATPGVRLVAVSENARTECVVQASLRHGPA